MDHVRQRLPTSEFNGRTFNKSVTTPRERDSKGVRGKNPRETSSYLALFSFSTRQMKIKERPFVIYARRDALIYRPPRAIARIERITIVHHRRNALL